MADERAVLISVRPRYAAAILACTKTVELRRTRMHVPVGTTLVIYSSSPVRAVVGTATIDRIEERPPSALWRHVSESSGVTREEFDDYFSGSSTAFGLHLSEPATLERPTLLSSMRIDFGMEPAQSFRYITAEQALRLTTRSGEHGTRAVIHHPVQGYLC